MLQNYYEVELPLKPLQLGLYVRWVVVKVIEAQFERLEVLCSEIPRRRWIKIIRQIVEKLSGRNVQTVTVKFVERAVPTR